MKESFSVLIPDGESGFALFVAHCLSIYPNVTVHVLSRKRWSPIRFSHFCRSYTYKQTNTGDDSWVSNIADVVRKKGIDVLLPTDTNGISLTIANKDSLSTFVSIVPLPETSIFEITNNKWLLARFLMENQLPSPPTLLTVRGDDFYEKLLELDFPVLLKPTTSRDGDGIKQFENAIGLIEYIKKQNPEAFFGKFIVQSRLPGDVVGLNILSDNGILLAATIQKGIIPNTKKFAAAGAIRFLKDDKYLMEAKGLVKNLFQSGFANVDTLCDADNNLRILDVNTRFWGSLRGSLAAGVSFPYLACLTALGVSFPLPDYEVVRYFHPKTALREVVNRVFIQSRQKLPALREMELKFLLTDPFSELMRIYNQEVLNQ